MNTITRTDTARSTHIDTDQHVSTSPAFAPSDDDGGRLLIISGSLRESRMSSAIAAWVSSLTVPQETDAPPDRHGFSAVSVLDLAEVELPDDGLLVPGGGPTTSVTEAIAAADAFVVVSPEYNHSYPAGLKRFIDWHYSEWAFKAALIVAYGSRGGIAASEHLRGVFAELSVVTARRSLGLIAPWTELEDGAYRPGADTDAAGAAGLSELAWWSRTLLAARRDRPFEW